MKKRRRRGRPLAVFALLALLGACSGLSITLEGDEPGPGETGGDGGGEPMSSGGAQASAGEAGNENGPPGPMSEGGAASGGTPPAELGGAGAGLSGAPATTGGVAELEGGAGGQAGSSSFANEGGVGGEAPSVCYGDNWEVKEIACFRGIPDGECGGADVDFRGCLGSGCTICSEHVPVAQFPFYFQRHPCCSRNDSCFGTYFRCDPSCPEPNEFDRVPLCPWYVDQYR